MKVKFLLCYVLAAIITSGHAYVNANVCTYAGLKREITENPCERVDRAFIAAGSALVWPCYWASVVFGQIGSENANIPKN